MIFPEGTGSYMNRGRVLESGCIMTEGLRQVFWDLWTLWPLGSLESRWNQQFFSPHDSYILKVTWSNHVHQHNTQY